GRPAVVVAVVFQDLLIQRRAGEHRDVLDANHLGGVLVAGDVAAERTAEAGGGGGGGRGGRVAVDVDRIGPRRDHRRLDAADVDAELVAGAEGVRQAAAGVETQADGAAGRDGTAAQPVAGANLRDRPGADEVGGGRPAIVAEVVL